MTHFPRHSMVSTILSMVVLLVVSVNIARADHPDRVLNLPGLSFTPSFAHYSGYIPLPSSPSMLHYWMVESQNDPTTDPVVLWLNGGPGCSSMLGMLTENGPFRLQPDGATIDLNPQAWNQWATVIYLESPSGVGFSYGTNNNYTSGDVSTAADNFAFLQGFFAEYPEFSTQRFYISGESFAGNYVLELAQVVAHSNEKIAAGLSADIQINLAGIAVGNPTMDWNLGANAYFPFMAYHGFISDADYQNAVSICDGVFQPPPNQACADLVANLTLNIYGINPYNVEDLCRGAGWGSEPGCFTLDLLNSASKPRPFEFYQEFPGYHPSAKGVPLSQTFVPCIDLTPIRTYLNSANVMSALHIAADLFPAPWDACSQVLHYTDIEGSMIPIYEDLLANTTIRILIYSGDVDSCVPYLGTEQTVMSFPYVQKTPFQFAWQSWHYVSAEAPSVTQIAGKFMQWGERLAYATVRGAGHMVPHDQAEAAAQLFYSFLNDPTRMTFRELRPRTVQEEEQVKQLLREL